MNQNASLLNTEPFLRIGPHGQPAVIERQTHRLFSTPRLPVHTGTRNHKVSVMKAMLPLISLVLLYFAAASSCVADSNSYPPEGATRKAVLADVFAKQIHPGMNESEVWEILKPLEEEVDKSTFHWISMLAGWVPLKYMFKEKGAVGFIILPPQMKLAGARNYELNIPVTIQFEETPKHTDEDMKQSALDFFKGKRKGKLLEFAIVCEMRGPTFLKHFYFGPEE